MCQVAFEEKALETAVENAVEALASRILNGYKSILSHTQPVPCHVGRSMRVFQTSIVKMNRFRQLQKILPRLELRPWFHRVGVKGLGFGCVLKGLCHHFSHENHFSCSWFQKRNV